MTRIAAFTFNGFEENTYVLSDESGACVIIDPGCSTPSEEQELASYIREHHLRPERLINTHCHIDHILGNAFVTEQWNLKPEAHRNEIPVLESAEAIARAYGLPYRNSPPIAHFLEEGQSIRFGNTTFKLLFVPGHSPGHIALYQPDEKFILSGDVLFLGSIGRYDLPGSNFNELVHSIMNKLMKLPGEVKVYPGHGPSTRIDQEREKNPFIAEFAALKENK